MSPRLVELVRESYPLGTAARHGTNSRYTSGCRCERCRRSHADYAAQRRQDRQAAGLDKPTPKPPKPPKPPTDEHALTGGKWVPSGLIMRWEAKP